MWNSLIALLARLAARPAPPAKPAAPAAKAKPKVATPAKITGGVSALVIAAAAFIQPWEGREYVAYQDIVGIWTICDGETRGVRSGDTATAAQCDAMFFPRVAEFNDGLDRCITDPAAVPDKAKIAFVSWSYNVGLGAACGSTLIRKLNAGDLRGACEELPRWNRAGGSVVRGLSNRRGAERALCLSAVPA